MLDLRVIEVGQYNYASHKILVESLGKDPRLRVNYRALNAKTQMEFFPMPNIEQVVESVSTASFILVIQMPLLKQEQRYIAFVISFRAYISKKIMFGLINSRYYFCK